MNLDRFSQGLPDAQEALPVDDCAGCGGSLYPGDTVVELSNGLLLAHEDLECILSAEDLNKERKINLICAGCREVFESGEGLVWLESDRYCHRNIECLIQALGAKIITAE